MLATYIHLLPTDLPDAAILDAVPGDTERDTSPAETSRNRAAAVLAGNGL